MYTENIRRRKSALKMIESLVFQKFPQDPSPLQLIRFKRQERLSRVCALILAVVMLVGIGAQIGKFVDVVMTNKSIKALQADNKLLEVSVGNLQVELAMKTQDSVICHLASRDLGMIHLDLSQERMVLPVGKNQEGETQLMSNGYQQ